MNEQTSKERGPKGSGGAAPEAAAASHVALPCNCQHCGAIDKSQHSLVCPARLSDDYVQELRARAAAPIAPAAQGLVQELVRVLKALVGNPLFDVWRCQFCNQEAAIGEEIKHDADCIIGRAHAALARAERKEGEAKHG